MFCHQCGASIPAGASFCSGCGIRIVKPLAQTSAVAAPIGGNSEIPNIESTRTHTPGASAAQSDGSGLRMVRPRGITTLAALAFVTAISAFSIGIALSSMAAGASAESAVPQMQSLMRLFPVLAQGEQEMVSQASFVAAAMFLIAATYAMLGYGLWTLRKWARTLAMVICALFALRATIMILASSGAIVWHLFVLGVNIWIITYLLKPRVKQSFPG